MAIPNHITLDDLRNMQIGEIVALPAEQLVLLQDAANEALRSAKTTSDWLEGAIALKYTDRAVMARTRICCLRGDIAAKVGGDTHFRSAHQPIRVAGSIYYKNSLKTQVRIVELNASFERDLDDFIEAVTDMPPAPGISLTPDFSASDKPAVADVLVTPVREGAQDDWSRFEGASAAIGHYIRMVHDGRLSKDEGWQAICEYNAAMLRPAWPVERLKRESERLWSIHVDKHGPPLIRLGSAAPAPNELPTFTLGALLDDTTPMPGDIIAPRVLTPGGLLVLGGAPKVGKSDLLITWLVHMAAGVPFLGFTPSRPLRIFYLQAEIQYHYLRERMQQIGLPRDLLGAARDNLVATPKLQMLLDVEGSVRVAAAIRRAFPAEPADIICIDPIRNLFDGGPDGRRVFAMEISPAYVDVAVERWQAETGRDAILDGDGRTFAQVGTERLGDDTDTPDTDAEPEPARKRKTAA